ncbi:MAG: dynamin family protein, partial [Bradymonadaceae bacterium]
MTDSPDDGPNDADAAPADSSPAEQEDEDRGVLPVDRDEVEELLVDLGEIADESGFDSLYEEIYDDRLPALREGRMSVVTLGEFNHGKSTVVNALLGEEVLPVGITPTTSVITHLVWGEEPGATVHPTGRADSYDIGYDELDDAIREAEESDVEEPEYVEIQYPNELLEDSLVLVDTPGVNDISRQKVEITYGYVPRADVILYVLDATQILKKSEVKFIEDRLLEANRDRIVFVLGKIDALDEEDAQEVEAYARERLESIMGPVDLYAFSARDAVEARRSGDEPPEAFREFRADLIAYLRDRKAEIILDSALGGGMRIAGMLEQNLAIERQGYRLEKQELEERIERVEQKLEESRQLIADNLDLIEERIGGIAATARHNLHVFRDEFKEELPRQIEAAEARDIQLYLSAWIQDQFKEWLESEGAEIAESLEELAEEVIEITNESIQET